MNHEHFSNFVLLAELITDRPISLQKTILSSKNSLKTSGTKIFLLIEPKFNSITVTNNQWLHTIIRYPIKNKVTAPIAEVMKINIIHSA